MKKPEKKTVELRVAFELPAEWSKTYARKWALGCLKDSAMWRRSQRDPAPKNLKVSFV